MEKIGPRGGAIYFAPPTAFDSIPPGPESAPPATFVALPTAKRDALLARSEFGRAALRLEAEKADPARRAAIKRLLQGRAPG